VGQRLVYLDAGAIIRLVQSGFALSQSVQDAIVDAKICTSVLSITECLTGPIRDADHVTIDLFDRFFRQSDLRVIVVNEMIARAASSVRAKCKMKTPDAIHAATAIHESCDTIVTSDNIFTRLSLAYAKPAVVIIPAV